MLSKTIKSSVRARTTITPVLALQTELLNPQVNVEEILFKRKQYPSHSTPSASFPACLLQQIVQSKGEIDNIYNQTCQLLVNSKPHKL